MEGSEGGHRGNGGGERDVWRARRGGVAGSPRGLMREGSEGRLAVGSRCVESLR